MVHNWKSLSKKGVELDRTTNIESLCQSRFIYMSMPNFKFIPIAIKSIEINTSCWIVSKDV